LGGSQLPSDILVGPDGALWFTEFTGVGIGRITTSGAITQFPDNILTRGNHESFAIGQDGAFWFTDSPVGGNYLGGYVGRMTISGTYSAYLVPEVDAILEPRRIVSGSDGALWFLISTPTSQIGRMTTSGALTLYPLPANTSTYNMVVGPDGALWITESEQGSIMRVTP
jgi:virginiamycin B lyase